MAAGGKHRALSVANAEGERKAIEGHWHGWERVGGGGW
jgi:hypothetical protein